MWVNQLFETSTSIKVLIPHTADTARAIRISFARVAKGDAIYVSIATRESTA